MLKHLTRNRAVWLITAILALVAAVVGGVNPAMYESLLPAQIMAGVLAQDYGSIAAALLLAGCAWRASERSVAPQIVAIGLLGYFFYAYGIYTIEQLYTLLYPVYMAVFGLSFYGIVYGLVSLDLQALQSATVPRGLRRVSIGFLLLNPVVFYPLWLSMLVPLLRSGDRIEFTFSIFILDLCFIMPAFLVAAVALWRDRGFGIVTTPMLFVVGVMLLGPLALGEFLKPRYGFEVDPFGLGLFGTLSAVFLVLSVIYIRTLDFEGDLS